MLFFIFINVVIVILRNGSFISKYSLKNLNYVRLFMKWKEKKHIERHVVTQPSLKKHFIVIYVEC